MIIRRGTMGRGREGGKGFWDSSIHMMLGD